MSGEPCYETREGTHLTVTKQPQGKMMHSYNAWTPTFVKAPPHWVLTHLFYSYLLAEIHFEYFYEILII